MDISGETGPLVIDGTDASFMQDVIEASQDTPVLVDFWAEWCGPCKQLTPVLEKVVGQAAGAVKLVKIDIDKNPGVAGQMGVRSIPAVFAFKGGRPVDGFQGALPESQVVEFIKRLGGGDALEQIEEALKSAAETFEAGDIGGAAQIYAEIVRADPENAKAIAGLARCYLANEDLERAAQTLEMVPADKREDPDVKSVATAIELAANASAPDETADLAAKVAAAPEDHDARFELANALAGLGRHEEAADHLLAILEKKLDWKDGEAKAQLLKIFEAAGPTADVTKDGRRRLSSLLFK
ncbi:MAG: thioredoxin [Pseudomonadota bacterium]